MEQFSQERKAKAAAPPPPKARGFPQLKRFIMKDKLKQLKELDAHLDVIKMDKQEAIDEVITAELKAKLASFDEITSAIIVTAATLEAEIKAEVLVSETGAKKGANHYGVSFVKGRVSWDIKALDGYAAAHPEIEKFKKVGKPSVRINKK